MKKIFSLFLIISALIAFSCSDDATGPGGGGFGGGGGGGGVTFTVTVVQDQQTQEYFFRFKPDKDVVINSMTANCAAAGVNNQNITGFDGTKVYNANNPADVGPVTVTLTQGQQWSFPITGKIGSGTGTSYSVTATCNI